MSDIENQQKGRYNSSSFSVIGEDAIYRGDVEFEGVLHINGDFYGNIEGNGDLGVGLTGRVRSVIHANNVLISGLVCGNVFALGRVGIKSSAIVIGDIQAASLVVEEGSILQGKLEILNGEEQRKIAKPGLFLYRKTGVGEEAPEPQDHAQSADQSDGGDAASGGTEPEVSPKDNKGSKGSKGKYSVWN
ncbi:polymer-forming cytoskeletal protein [Candidatus Haliotispira prima]|uniref:Polymer-forming cytoskeletal protein n=1 Tax=Candidatus Haliotispira prima TaxID=3034016 RepID=A0ABY8MEK7_9SPIO|nr:polymer-forming cytoskeletal protein [Candidatus Haliotispira prima]